MILRIGHVKLVLHIRQARCFTSTSKVAQKFHVLFCGSDDFSIASLRALRNATDIYESIHVLTPGESRVGRGGRKQGSAQKQLSIPPLLSYAREHEIPHTTIQDLLAEASDVGKPQDWLPPEPFRHPSTKHLLLTASFGYIIPTPFLKLFAPEQRLNVHPSLLPRYRGAAPIQWTIANGDQTTGVTVQRLVEKDKGIDAGEIIGQVDGIRVPEDATYESFTPNLAGIGGELLVKALREIQAGTSIPRHQDETLRSRAPKINKETAHIRWSSQSAAGLDALHRAIGYHNPLWTELDGVPIQLIGLSKDTSGYTPPDSAFDNLKPGFAILDKSSTEGKAKRMMIACAAGDADNVESQQGGVTWLQVRTVKPLGKSVMSVKDWWNGAAKSKSAGITFDLLP